MGSTMGLPLVAFLGAWALMMAAMMLPTIAPVASLYVRAMGARPGGRLVSFGLGYLLVWTLVGFPAFGVAFMLDALVRAAPAAERWGVIAILVALAAYQLTPLKQLCLRHCRSPLSQLLRYASYRGGLRDLRVGMHHGLYCAGCCWPLMLLLVAVGTMTLRVMLALTVVVLGERLLPRGDVIAYGVALAAVGAAMLFVVSPVAFERVVGA